MQQKIWAYFLYLSRHMWADENSTTKAWYPTSHYTPENETDVETWDLAVKFIAERKFNTVVIDVGDGIQYDKHPEISAPDAWSKAFLKQKLDEMRALGLEPIPKLNFSACHDTWLKEYRRMLSTPAYYQACADCIEEVAEVFGHPRYFHLGLDEEIIGEQINYEMVVIRGADLWWHDVYFLFDEVKKHGARPWIWADYYWAHPEQFAEKMPRDVLLSNWYYSDFADFPVGSFNQSHIQAYEDLNKLGFDQVPGSSTWIRSYNSYQTMMHAKKVISPEHQAGFMTIPWYHTAKDNLYVLYCDADKFYTARRDVFPESL